MLRRIFGKKRDKITGGCRKLHNKELHILSSSPNIIKMIKQRRFTRPGNVIRTGEKRNAHRVLVGKPEVRRDH
jgi:hypothetical protein